MSLNDLNPNEDRDFPDAFATATNEAKIWGFQVLQRLEDSANASESRPFHLPDPDSILWSIPLANQLLNNWPDVTTDSAGESANALLEKTTAGSSDSAGSTSENPAELTPHLPAPHQVQLHRALEILLERISQWLRQVVQLPVDDDASALHKLQAVQAAAELYVKIRHGQFGSSEGPLLQVLFASGHSTALRMGVDLLVQQPPDAWTSASLALSPLVQYDDWDPAIIFPRIFGTSNPAILATALDIANFLFGKKRVAKHPAEEHYETLVLLLGQIVQRLGVLEENPAKFGEDAKSIQRILFDSVSLCVSLCHTMSYLGKENCIGKLNQALELKHRRIRTEAAFALAKLKEKQGEEALVELAGDPAVRSRVIAYAEELGCIDKIDESHRSVLAIAESQLAQWLGQVEQMGLPPTRIELLEQRTLVWPGFDAPQECFLFRFGYGMQDSEFSNVGFAGPVAKAFSLDLANVAIDDAFAIFAGWDIEHPEAYETPANRLSIELDTMVAEWIEGLQAEIFDDIEPIFLGTFFGLHAFGAYGSKEGKKISLVYDGRDLVTLPMLPANQESLALTYYLWRGREFFRSF